MKKSFLLLICVLFSELLISQEDKGITERLKSKYGFVCYHEDNGGWYSISRTGDYHSKGNQGACDLRGREVIPPIWDEVYNGGTFYKVEKNGFTGIMDLNNKELLPCSKYTDVYWYQKNEFGGFCEVEINKKLGVIDVDNKLIIPCNYDNISVYELKDGEFCKVSLNGKSGVVNKKGEEIVSCKYDDINTWQLKDCSYCEVKMGGKAGVIDNKGKEVLPCGEYDYIGDFVKSHYAPVSKGLELRYGMFNTIERILKNGKWGIYDLETGKEIVPCKYDYIRSEQDGIFAFNIGGLYENDKLDDIKGGKWGFVDTTGKEIIHAQYNAVSTFEDGVAQVTKDGVTSMLAHPLKGASVKMASGASISIDTNIPETNKSSENTFAFIIANENYAHLTGADYSINDGKVFASYCIKTLGLPEKNVRYYEDATYGNIVNAIKKIQDIADVYDGEATIIFYFSGLGATESKSSERYLLATDASLASLQHTGYSVTELLKVLNNLKTVYTWVVLDAPFSNVDKKGKTLADARGVAIKPKSLSPQGSVVVSQASEGEEAAYSNNKYAHSLFTYGLLEKLQQTKGNCTLKELTDYANQWTKKNSLITFDKVQSPITSVSEKIANKWNNIKF